VTDTDGGGCVYVQIKESLTHTFKNRSWAMAGGGDELLATSGSETHGGLEGIIDPPLEAGQST
jgi:hypothetical protein